MLANCQDGWQKLLGNSKLIIVFFLFKKTIHWSVWPSAMLCVIGGYLLTNFQDATIRLGDSLVVVSAIFWALHIIFIGKIIEEFNTPILIGLVQTLVVSSCSIVLSLIFEEFIISNILSHKVQILYAGILSGGFAFVLQIYAQKNITPAPAAIIFSLEGVFAAIAAWIILNQILSFNNIVVTYTFNLSCHQSIPTQIILTTVSC